jgi:hypothetical protein
MTALALSVAAQLVLGFGTPIAIAWIGSHIKDAQMRGAVSRAAQNAAGIAYEVLARPIASVPGATPTLLRDQAINAGVQYLNSVVPDALAALDMREQQVRQMVTGELGKLMAVDPNIALNPAAVPAALGVPKAVATAAGDLIPPLVKPAS